MSNLRKNDKFNMPILLICLFGSLLTAKDFGLINADFDSGSSSAIDGWNILKGEKAFSLAVDKEHNEKYLLVRCDGSENWIRQSLKCTFQDKIIISADIKTDKLELGKTPGKDFYARLYVHVLYDGRTGKDSSHFGSEISPGSGDWRRQKVTVTPKKEWKVSEIWVTLAVKGVSGRLYMDNVRIDELAVSQHYRQWANADNAVMITDMRKAEPTDALSQTREKNKWKVISYDAQGFSGSSITASAYAAAPAVSLPLELKGYYAVYIGLGGGCLFTHNQTAALRMKLSNDTAYQYRIYSAGNFLIDEVFFKVADLTGRQLQLAQMATDEFPCTVMYVKCVPLTDEEVDKYNAQRSDNHTPLIATIDGFSWIGMSRPRCYEEFLEYFEVYRDSDFKIWWWGIGGGSDMVNYPTKVGTFLGSKCKDFPRKCDQYFVESMVELSNKGVNPNKVVIETGHSMGAQVHAYFRPAGWRAPAPFEELFSSEFYEAHPQWRCRDIDGTIVSYMSYAEPGVQKHVLEMFEEIMQFGYDGIVMTYIRGLPLILYEDAFCKTFTDKYNIDPRTLGDDDERIHDSRCEILTGFMRDIRQMLDKYGKEKQLSVLVFGNEQVNKKFGIDLRQWVNEALVDNIAASASSNGVKEAAVPIDTQFYLSLTKGTDVKFFPVLYAGGLESAVKAQQNVIDWYEHGVESFAVWDPEPVKRYRAASSYDNPQNFSCWPLLLEIGNKTKIRENIENDAPQPTHIPLKRYGDDYISRWRFGTGF